MKGGVTDSPLPCLAGSSMGGIRGAPQRSASPRVSQQSKAKNVVWTNVQSVCVLGMR